MGDDTRVLHENKRERFTPQDKGEGDSNSQRKKVTEKAEEALVQLKTRQYCASMKDHIMKLPEHHLAFLGPYCAVVECSLEWKQGGTWVITDTYGSIKDEEP